MTETTPPRLVLPGDLLGTAEEFVPGHGTYEDHGKIYAALYGHPTVDPNDRAIRVEAIHAIPEIREGGLIYGRVEEVKSAMAIVNILSAAGNGRSVPGTPEGTIHISKAKDGYTDSLADEFAPGDVVLAKVLQARPTVKLTTAPSKLGVVAARCQVCHAVVARQGKDLVCPRCGNHERRKVASGYGELTVPAGPSDGDGAAD